VSPNINIGALMAAWISELLQILARVGLTTAMIAAFGGVIASVWGGLKMYFELRTKLYDVKAAETRYRIALLEEEARRKTTKDEERRIKKPTRDDIREYTTKQSRFLALLLAPIAAIKKHSRVLATGALIGGGAIAVVGVSALAARDIVGARALSQSERVLTQSHSQRDTGTAAPSDTEPCAPKAGDYEQRSIALAREKLVSWFSAELRLFNGAQQDRKTLEAMGGALARHLAEDLTAKAPPLNVSALVRCLPPTDFVVGSARLRTQALTGEGSSRVDGTE
jgi:hypothetical protein